MKAIVFLYSMESFLFVRINKLSREKELSAIKTLGPYSVGLTMVINKIEAKRTDRMIGKFTCYRGLVLSKDMIQKWAKKKEIELDGYNSTSMDLKVAMRFA